VSRASDPHGASGPGSPASRLPRAELLLDTDRAAAGVGMRSAGATPRQLVFRHGRYQLDLMAPAPRSSGPARFLWGQILQATDAPCAGATVAWLADDGSVLVEAAADELGEFSIATSPTAQGTLRVRTQDGAFVCPLPPDRGAGAPATGASGAGA
jgi:hypothetical protein